MPEPNAPAGTLIKTSLVDFPGLVACTVFLAGCNLRCPYCYNTSLVNGTLLPEESSTLQEILSHLEKRKSVLQGIVVSGGEALLNPNAPVIIRKARSLGYKIKLDTNGTLPAKLAEFMSDDELRPDYVAMDLKCPAGKLGMLTGSDDSVMRERLWEKITESARIISGMKEDAREWRTVMVPGLVTRDDIGEMASILPDDARWYLARFQNGNCLDERYSTLPPYTPDQESGILEAARRLRSGACIR